MMTSQWSPRMAEHVEDAKKVVCELHAELIKWNLVVWTAGNVS